MTRIVRGEQLHELTHMVHGEHDAAFWAYLSALTKEARQLDWTQAHAANSHNHLSTRMVDSDIQLGQPTQIVDSDNQPRKLTRIADSDNRLAFWGIVSLGAAAPRRAPV